MLPGQKYAPEDILRLAWRRKWLIVAPAILGLAAAVVYERRLPDLYRSDTMILVVPQRVPETYVKSTVSGSFQDRLATISEQILSRTRLERIVVDLNLFQRERSAGMLMEDAIARMRQNISVQNSERESFRVSYVSSDAKTAQRVTERLASLFIEENLRDRENLAENTSEFLESQLEDARRRLIDQEKKLEEYRRRYSGQLPTQAPSNLQAIQNLQMQLGTLGDSVARDRDRRLLLERQIADLEAPDPLMAATAPGTDPTGAGTGGTLAQRYENAKAALALLRTQKRPDHPDVKALERTIRDLEAEIKAHGEDPPAPTRVVSPAELQRQRRIRELKEQIADIDRALAQKEQTEKNIRGSLGDYQSRVDAAPTRESELTELTRDYATLQATYQSLLAKREDSKIAVNLERRNIGEQFRVLDPARVPQRPFSPNRNQLRLIGLGSGLALGMLLVGVLEYRDGTFKTEDEVVRVLALPVLAVVPVMASVADAAAIRRRTLMFTLALAVLAAGSAAVLIWNLQS